MAEDSIITPEQKEKLHGVAGEGDTIRSFCKHPGFALYKKVLEAKIADSKNRWLIGTEEEAKQSRYRAQGIMEALGELKKFMLSGDNARNLLNELAAEPNLETPQTATLELGQGNKEK